LTVAVFTAVVADVKAVVVLVGTVVMLAANVGKGPTVRSSDIDTDLSIVSAIVFSKFRSNPIASSLQNGGF
jgi:hypothetical protein